MAYRLNVDAKAIGWKEKFLEFNGKIYSYVMNNYWHTNFKADQEGPCRFRYVLWVGEKQDAAFSSKLAAEVSRPLIVVPLKNGATIPAQRESLRTLLDEFSANPELEIAQISEDSGLIEILAWNMSNQSQRVGSWDFDPFELRWIKWSG